ncbi:MAG: hypothetical protein FD129_88 [bacterium]|nr:MAG: hypothetical protein FD129_88 [bacterium]
MTAVVLALAFFVTPSHAFRTPSADEAKALWADTSNAYADQHYLEAVEEKLQKAAKDNSPNWERKLSQPQQRELAAARLRASASWSDVIEKNLVAYGLIKTRPSPVGGPGIPEYPDEVMHMGETKEMRRQWKVQFAQPVEGTVKGEDGKVLRGDEFREFLIITNGMTSPDGTTIVWGERYLKDPHRLAIVLRHELAHYEQFADPKVEETTWAEREIESYKRSKSFIKHMGLPPKVREYEEALEEGGVVKYSSKASTEKSKREQRPFYERVYDRGRAYFGLKPRIEDPGYHQQAGYHMDPEAWVKIRDDGNAIQIRVERQRTERALIEVAGDICSDPSAAHDPALRQRYYRIPGYAGGRTLPITDPCTAEIAEFLFAAKGRGSNDFWADHFVNIARGHQETKPDPRPAGVVMSAFRFAAEKICSDPARYSENPELREWFRTEKRFDRSLELRGLSHGCVMTVAQYLWKTKQDGATVFDAVELRRLAETALQESANLRPAPPAVTAPVIPSPPPSSQPPPPPPPFFSEPEPRRPQSEPFKPCLHDRCVRRL